MINKLLIINPKNAHFFLKKITIFSIKIQLSIVFFVFILFCSIFLQTIGWNWIQQTMTESGEKFKMSQAAEQVLKNGAILAPSKEHKSTIIFLHGLGDSGHSWAFGLKGMRVALPNTKIVCPTAPQAKVTLNNGHASTSWHDLGSLSEIDSEEKNTYAGVDENLKIVQEIIEKEIDSGIPSEKIVIAGFSQGFYYCFVFFFFRILFFKIIFERCCDVDFNWIYF